MRVQELLEPDSVQELDSDSIGHGVDHSGAVVCRVDVDAKRTRTAGHVDDVGDRLRNVDRVGVRGRLLGQPLADLIHQLRVDGLVLGDHLFVLGMT
jgi:hypothetical protein